jgi:[CysO sulfur-carrier protein]-S-L-cysteine hydrolase
MVFELPQAMYEEIVAHARAGMPNEACGVVAGEDGRPVRVYPMRNAEDSPVIYRFDSREQLHVSDEIEEKGWETLAFFHSHTHTEAYPSPTDRKEAHWPDPLTGEIAPRHPGIRYLILSLAEDEPVLRAFNLDGEEPLEEDVRIT